jgi:hypothetical protein
VFRCPLLYGISYHAVGAPHALALAVRPDRQQCDTFRKFAECGQGQLSRCPYRGAIATNYGLDAVKKAVRDIPVRIIDIRAGNECDCFAESDPDYFATTTVK